MIAIKDFGMPSCCDNCDIFNCADNACHITYTRCENPFNDRNDDCPLIEVEPKESEKIHCNHTDTEIAKSFIKDVEAVKDLLPKAESEE